MVHFRGEKLLEQGNQLFGAKSSLLSLWQEIAENFYVERATFTTMRSLGDDFADQLTTSYPLLVRRELGDNMGAMLRPKNKPWVKITTRNGPTGDVPANRWLDWATGLMRNAMYDPDSGFVRATKEGDHDYVTFGQCCISTEWNWRTESMLYRCHHLKDVVWSEAESGRIERVDRRYNPRIIDLIRKFGKKSVHHKLLEDSDQTREVECRHIVVPVDLYESAAEDRFTGKPKKFRQPFVSIYIDVENDHIIEEVGSWTKIYTIPRWQTVSGSQYSYSPATVCALPDARLIQSIALTLLEAGEKYTNPPMIAVQEAIRGDVNLFSGGITWADQQYDERLGEVLRPITQDRGGFGIGIEIQSQVQENLFKAFYLNKMNLPEHTSAEMTAFETAQRVEEYVREALPIFEPTEYEYNESICADTFETLMRVGVMGGTDTIPETLHDKEIKFQFVSPLHQAEERLKGQQFTGALELINQALALDPSSSSVMKIRTALSEAVMSSGAPAKWMNNEEEMAALDEQAEEQAEMEQMMAVAGQGADVLKTAGEATAAFAKADGDGEAHGG